MSKIFVIFTALCLTQFSFAAKQIVLVPGFFSSAIPAPQTGGNPWKQPYFSQDIVQSISRNGDHVWVVDNLNPVGGIQENGERLIQFLNQHLANLNDAEKSEQLILVAHSAGGLYSLYAAAHSDLPISRLITLSTPFHGLNFLDNLEQAHLPLEALAAPFCLENLLGLRESSVQGFLSTVRIRRPLRMDVFAGYQPVGLMTWNFRVLSPPLVAFQVFIGEPSDGIVAVRSSMDASALTAQNPSLQLVIHPSPIALEHWELVVDSQMYRLIGVLNIEGLRRAQTQSYRDIFSESGL